MTTLPERSTLMVDGVALRLHFGRFDERQRRQQLRFPTVVEPWSYATLVDVVRWDSDTRCTFFTGKTASQWFADLLNQSSTEAARFKSWYEGDVNPLMVNLAQRPRVPDNHYCMERSCPWRWCKSTARTG